MVMMVITQTMDFGSGILFNIVLRSGRITKLSFIFINFLLILNIGSVSRIAGPSQLAN